MIFASLTRWTGLGKPSRLLALTGVRLSALSQNEAMAAVDAEQRNPVAVIVRVAKPWYAPKSVVVSKMRETTDQYANTRGLAFKAFSLERQSGDFGGIYLWNDRSNAQAWFNKDWFDRVKRERGTDAIVRMFDAPIVIDNIPEGTPADADSPTVATLVEIAMPAGVGPNTVAAGFKDAIATYQRVPGLLRKYFITSDKGSFGGIYLWKDEASANAWFNQAWKDRVEKTYGQPARLEWFDTPILTPSKDASNALSPLEYFQAK
jgi:heme-degrading monooxygenase HmoA